MKICQNCKKEFTTKKEIDGKIKNLQRRKFCLECSPFGEHNTSKILDYEERKNINEEKRKERNKKMSQHITNWRRKAKKKLIEYKGGKCEKCGYNKDFPSAYDFHHKAPKEKDFSISSNGNTRSIEKMRKEVDKCMLLCATCHREIHHYKY